MSEPIFMVFLLLTCLTAAQRRSQAPAKANPLAGDEQAIAQGRDLYQHSCTVCHGLDGAVGDRGPALAGARRYLRTTDQDLFDAIRQGIPGTDMPPSGLPEGDVWKVVAYIRSLRATAADAFVQGDIARGGEIFWGKGRCGHCHMIRGRGGLLGPDLTNIGGQRTLQFLRESLTKRRPRVPRGYQPVEVVTADGKRLSGVIKNENNFSMQILDSSNQIQLFTRDELREVVYKSESLMPGNYDRVLTAVELQDLLAFLSRQAIHKIQDGTGEDQ
jgi:cytochrome c oxidase cbb3-type subunit 3